MMQGKTSPMMRLGVPVVLSVMVLGALALTLVLAASPAQAQLPPPTPTPQTPIWLAFSAARDAIQAEHPVNLGFVQRWEWVQEQWPEGIDTCRTLDNPNAAQDAFVGWTFRITSLQGQTYEARVSFDLQATTVCDQVSSAAAASGAADPNLPAPVAGAGAVGGFELGGHALEMSLNTFNTMRTAGMTWVKQQVEFRLGDDPAKVAGLIDSAHSTGFKILLGIVGEQGEMGDFDNYINQYSQFVAGVAALGADAIEVWNEPNIDREWTAAQINGANYTRLLAAAFNAIKSSRPETLVISAAPAPTGFFGAAGCGAGGCNDDIFMQQMADAGAAQFMDCVGLHYNEGIIPPGQAGGDPRGAFPTYFFGSMTQRGFAPFGGTPVCYTELGYLSPEGFNQPLPANFAWAADTSVAEQAAWLAEAVSIAAQGGQVRLMIIWNVDFPFFTATDPMGGYAILRPDGSCPACGTLGQVMAAS